MIDKTFLKYTLLFIAIGLLGNSCNRNKLNQLDWSPSLLHIEIKSEGLEKLRSKRNKALDNGLLVTEKDSWVKGKIRESKNSKEKKIKLRLKGDWLDHLEGGKWSFRIKVKDSNKWNDLSVFSLQNPKTRSYLKEWVLHQWFKKENILTTKYDFINLQINDSSKGLYAFEEHFDKTILDKYQRTNGPILKFTENGLWEMRANRLKKEIKVGEDYEHLRVNTDIKPFQEKTIIKSKSLSELYIKGQQLMFDYMHGNKPLNEVFDLNILAKYYAIVDITRGYHGIFWHNQRFYYNPDNKKLEPIGFDGYDDTGSDGLKVPFIGFNLALNIDENELLFSNIFKDFKFVERYINYLTRFCEKEYINNFISLIEKDLTDRKEYIQSLEKDYKFNCNYIYSNSKKITIAIQPNSSIIQTRQVDSNTIAICNRHCTAIKIVGEAEDEKKYQLFKSPTIISCTKNTHLPDFSKKIEISEKTNYLVYSILGTDSLFFAKINPWPAPKLSELKSNNNSIIENANNPYYHDKKNKRIVFYGNNIITKPLVFPPDYSIVILEGANLDLTNSSYVFSRSPINFYGSSENPIKIYSSDSSSKGINIYNTNQKSRINYTHFKNGYRNTILTFDKANFIIDNCVFNSSTSQNLILANESKFSVYNSHFKNSNTNGIYSIFSEGKIKNCSFKNLKNNSINLSCTQITINNLRIKEGGNGIVVTDKDSIVPTIINLGNTIFENTRESHLLSKNSIINKI